MSFQEIFGRIMLLNKIDRLYVFWD